MFREVILLPVASLCMATSAFAGFSVSGWFMVVSTTVDNICATFEKNMIE
jgi:hypothetical protein